MSDIVEEMGWYMGDGSDYERWYNTSSSKVECEYPKQAILDHYADIFTRDEVLEIIGEYESLETYSDGEVRSSSNNYRIRDRNWLRAEQRQRLIERVKK